MRKLPLPAYNAIHFMTISVLTQGIFDIIIKLVSFAPFWGPMPWRVDFLSLTAISVLMGYQALIGIKRKRPLVTRNSVQLGILVEAALVLGDIIFIKEYQSVMPEIIYIRLPFIVFTSINIIILLYVIQKLNLLKTGYDKRQWF